MRVGFDLDGVLFDFAASLDRYICSMGWQDKYPHNPEYERWNFYEEWGIDTAQFIKLCNDGADAGFVFRGPARPGAVWSVNYVKAWGHSIHIITDRSFGKTKEVSEEATRLWLAEHCIPYDTLTFSADKTVVPTDMFVEDKLQNYDALAEAGVDVYLVNRPWNRVDAGDNRKRIDDVTDYALKVVAKEGILVNQK